jgi:hypothetical protein
MEAQMLRARVFEERSMKKKEASNMKNKPTEMPSLDADGL